MKQALATVSVPAAKVTLAVHDESANAVLAGEVLTKHGQESQVCTAHLLQTAVHRSIKASKPVEELSAACWNLVMDFCQKEALMNMSLLKLT